jgi:uncharacterized membrane protein YbhN (UPF0104 family)
MRRAFVIIISIAIVLILVRAAGFREVWGVWRSVRPAGIALSVGCYLLSLFVRILAWRRLLGTGAPPAGRLAGPLALGFVLGHVAPAKTGEPAVALLVARTLALPLSRTLSVLAVERAVQLLLLLVTFLPAAAFAAGDRLELRGAVQAAGVLLVGLLAGLVAAGPVLRRVAVRIRGWRRFGPGAARTLEATADLLAERRAAPPLLALVAIFWFLQYLSLWAILDAGGASVNLIDAAVVAGAAIIGGTLTLLPLGTQDGISALVLGSLGVPMARGFALALFHTLLSLGCGLAVLLAALVLGRTASGTRTGA